VVDETCGRAVTAAVLVTGGTGTLGRLVVARLRDAGCDVRVLSRRRAAADGMAFVTGDLATGEGIEAAVDGAGTIVHWPLRPSRTGQIEGALRGAVVCLVGGVVCCGQGIRTSFPRTWPP
jgi:uncharacterized protein YbjT (DUF2867 family)